MENLFLLLFLVSIVALVVGLIKPDLVVRWGNQEKKNRKSVLKVYGLAMIAFSVLFSISAPSSNKDGIEDNELFNDVYYKIANRDQSHNKEDIINYLESSKFTINENKELNSLKVEDEANQNGDHVYISFDEVEEDSNVEMVSSISYYLEKEELEVLFTNYSPSNDAEYDKLLTHKLGESHKEVKSIKEQITFLNETKNEHKANKDEVKEKASENKKEDLIELNLNVEEKIKEGKVFFDISTNLPDNTTGSIALTNKDIDYTAQDKFEVNAGKAEAGPYSLKGESLPSGTYEVSVSTPLAEIQPDDVFIEIGEDYSNYTGDQFEDGDMGRNIRYSFEINIP